MESRGLTRQDLEPAIGSRARVAEILNRKRPLTLEMMGCNQDTCKTVPRNAEILAEATFERYQLAD